MSRRNPDLTPVDPEIERTLTLLRKESRRKEQASQILESIELQDMEHTNQEGAQLIQHDERRTLRDYAAPLVGEIYSSIRRPAIQATNFEINPAIIHMIQTAVQFSGLLSEDPNAHILNFLEICDTFKYNGVSDDAIRLRLFPFSLRDKAKGWLNSMPAGSITTWDDLARKFLAKFFPPAKTARMRNDILSFVQYDSESLYEAWERYKDLLRKCPHHNIPQWLQVQTFYNGLTNSLRSTIDAAAGGALMNKGIDEAYNLLEEMAANNYQWNTEWTAPRRVAGIHEVDAISALSAQVAALTKQLGEVKALTSSSSSSSPSCNNCGAAHPTKRCTMYTEEVQYVGSYQCPQQNNPYSNTYNPGWRNHPNFSWSNKQNTQQMDARPKISPGFSQPRQQPEKKPALENLMAQLIQVQTANAQTQTAAIKNLEMQMGHMANAMAQFHRQPGSLPSNTEPNPRREEREHCNAITLRSSTVLDGPQQPLPENHEPEPTSQIQSTPFLQKEPASTKPNKEPAYTEPPIETASIKLSTSIPMPQAQPTQKNSPPPTQKSIYPPPPFPQRLQKQRTDAQFSKFLEVLKQLHINIPFAEAFEQMPKYAKYMKESLTHKRHWEDHETVALTEECSAVLLKKLPPKLQDPLLAVLVDGYTSDEEAVATYDHQPKMDDMKKDAHASAKSYKRKRWRKKKSTKEHVEPGHQVSLDSSRLNLFPGRLKGD